MVPTTLKFHASKHFYYAAFAVTLASLIPFASAGEEEIRMSSDTAWLLSNAFVILTMQAGFGMLEAGMVSARSTSNILMKNLVDMAFGSVAFWVIGWRLLAGNGNSFAGEEIVTDSAAWVFNFAFAATASTILSGAVAGRMRFIIYCLISSAVTSFLYPLAARWAWHPDGFLFKMGYHDFAGDGPIHLLGGMLGMTGSWILGPRIGAFSDSGAFIPNRSSPSHALFGTFVLWWGWFAFNAGSTQSLADGMDVVAALAASNTGIASGAGTVVTVLLSFYSTRGKSVDVFETIGGVLAALVAITGPCAVVTPDEAAIIGALGAIGAYYTPGVVIKLRLDDPVGVWPVHMVGAIIGLLCVGLFANNPDVTSEKGLFHGGGFHLLGVQALAIVIYSAWGCVMMIILMKTVQRFSALRVTRQEEEIGLDETEHSIVSVAKGPGRKESFLRWSQEQLFFTHKELMDASAAQGNQFPFKVSRGESTSSVGTDASQASELGGVAVRRKPQIKGQPITPASLRKDQETLARARSGHDMPTMVQSKKSPGKQHSTGDSDQGGSGSTVRPQITNVDDMEDESDDEVDMRSSSKGGSKTAASAGAGAGAGQRGMSSDKIPTSSRIVPAPARTVLPGSANKYDVDE